ALADALLPPAILAVLGFALAVTGRTRGALFVLIALVILAVEGVPHLLMEPLVPLGAAEAGTPGAIVVIATGSPALLDTSRTAPSLSTLMRLRTAAAVYRRTKLPILVSGGPSPDGPVPLATEMAVSLRDDFGVPATWAETSSTNLWQSAAASAAILRKAGITEVDLVMQPWEFRLAAAAYRDAGLRVDLVPVVQAAARPLDWSALVLLTPVWLDSARAIEQWAGLTCQAIGPCVAWMRGPVRPDPS
ncbi:MAG: YdcF family protein, partial [Acetobacteraceae bacterium]|nr:YdcF family protein [Acetobacteraceae bacterium]